MGSLFDIDYVLYLAIVLLFFAFLGSFRRLWTLGWKTAIGKMTRLVVRPVVENPSSRSPKTVYHIEMEYEYEVDGQTQKGRSFYSGEKVHVVKTEEEARSFASEYAPDSRVLVYYNPLIYSDSALKRGRFLRPISVAFIALSGVAFYGYYQLWQRDNSPEAIQKYRATINYSLEVASRKRHRVYQIDQSWRTLRTIPRELEKFPNLEALNLSNNSIAEIPRGFKFPESLLRLNLSQNKFSRFPTGLERLPNLTHLDLSNNQIETDSGAALPRSLRVLDVSNNKLKTLSEYLARNWHLDTLYARNNQIESLPDRLYYDSYYDKEPPSLKVLDLRGNPISPKERKRILAQMPQTLVLMDEPPEEPPLPAQKQPPKPKPRLMRKRWGL